MNDTKFPPKKQALSLTQLSRCENALEPVCRCRCQGTRHGAKRVAGNSRSDFESLPVGDPHRLPTVQEIGQTKRAAKEEVRLHKLAKIRARMEAAGDLWKQAMLARQSGDMEAAKAADQAREALYR